MKNTKPVSNIVIVGGGTAGWMSAAALSRVVNKRDTAITLVESDAIATVGVGEATLPTLREFNHMLGIAEHDFISATNATFKTGVEFIGWNGPHSRYFNPFSEFGHDFGQASFYSAWLKAQKNGYSEPFDQFSIVCRAGLAGRFAKPGLANTGYGSEFNYAYHVDAGAYAKMLRRYAEARGVTRRQGKVQSCSICSQNGDILGLALEDGTEIAGDFFIDCSGFRALLLGRVLNVPFTSYKQWLPCDRAVALRTELTDKSLPHTRSVARSAGWSWHIPLQNRKGNGYVYDSRYLSDTQALAELTAQLDSSSICSEPNSLRFEAGARVRQWERNCVGIGLASGFLEPLESTSIALVQKAIYTLIDNFPSAQAAHINAQTFNAVMNAEYEQARDFIIAHYKLANPQNGAFWREQHEASIPKSLQQRLALFKQTGFVEDSAFGFTTSSWLAVLLGLGYYPQTLDARVEAASNDEITQFLNAELARIDETVQGFAPYP